MIVGLAELVPLLPTRLFPVSVIFGPLFFFNTDNDEAFYIS